MTISEVPSARRDDEKRGTGQKRMDWLSGDQPATMSPPRADAVLKNSVASLPSARMLHRLAYLLSGGGFSFITSSRTYASHFPLGLQARLKKPLSSSPSAAATTSRSRHSSALAMCKLPVRVMYAKVADTGDQANVSTLVPGLSALASAPEGCTTHSSPSLR